ncbi:MAG: hypothetical protein AAF311_11070, partial [Pseudomonadota bacterium]
TEALQQNGIKTIQDVEPEADCYVEQPRNWNYLLIGRPCGPSWRQSHGGGGPGERSATALRFR